MGWKYIRNKDIKTWLSEYYYKFAKKIYIQTCKSNCIQEEIISVCHCFHTRMDLSLLEEEKIPEDMRRPCSMAKDGGLYKV